MSKSIITHAAALGGGFLLKGMTEKSVAKETLDPETLGYWHSREATLQSNIHNLEQQIVTLQRISEVQGVDHGLKDELLLELEQQLRDLRNGQGDTITQAIADFPIVIGPGEPEAAGYIRGRDGLLIHRTLPNFLESDGNIVLGVQPGHIDANNTVVATNMAISDLSRSHAPKTIMIGRGPNSLLKVQMKKGLFESMAVILNFAEDVYSDTDFIAGGFNVYSGFRTDVACVPIGKKSLMLAVKGAKTGPPSGWNWDALNAVITRDVHANIQGDPTVAQRASYSHNGCMLSLSHRAARQLTLRSYNVIANPFLLYGSTSQIQGTELGDMLSRRVGAVTVVERKNLSGPPKIYVATTEGSYLQASIPVSSYA